LDCDLAPRSGEMEETLDLTRLAMIAASARATQIFGHTKAGRALSALSSEHQKLAKIT